MMKNILFSTLFMMIGYCSFGQSGMYLVTEEKGGPSAWAVSNIVVTDPQGNTTTSTITHAQIALASHFSELNVIFNDILNQGYEYYGLLEPPVEGYVNTTTSVTRQTWVFKVPWTDAGLVPAGVNNSSFSIEKIYPNPSDKELNIVLGSDAITGKVVVINMDGFIMHESAVNQEKEIKMDVSKLNPGKYVLRLVDYKFFTDEVPFVRN